MLYHLSQIFVDDLGGLNVTRYITFRSMIALLSSLFLSFLISPWLIRTLQIKQLGQVIRQDGPQSHLSKAGTPTMGGALILFAVLVPTLLWMDWTEITMWCTVFLFGSFGFLGFLDDYSKITKKNTKGVSARGKMLWMIICATFACTIHFYFTENTGNLSIPFFKDLTLPLGTWWIPLSVFIVVGTSNAVNLTDGLDGLAIGPVMISAACYAVLSYVSGHSVIAEYLQFPYVPGAGELAIFAAAIVGAGMGFLWYNTYPAQVFMGDIGSLPLGAGLGALAIFSRHEILLAIIGGIFVAEAVSVITQVASFKLTGNRIFRMAPLHHHFELKGWAEPKVIVRFWIISIVLSIIGLLSLKIR
ncbi:MAG: phospho-N-acetylmuramoyl-pentapeptide-transferase [Oligoflexales bacterium]